MSSLDPPTPSETEDQEPWFSEGLRFACTRCGRCCGGAPGNVWVTDDEVATLARRLGLSEKTFRRRYTRVVPGRGVSLTEKANYDCTFYRSGIGCTVYEDRPQQCRTWPFWRPITASAVTWNDAAEDCPGMNRGELHSAESILHVLRDDGLPEP